MRTISNQNQRDFVNIMFHVPKEKLDPVLKSLPKFKLPTVRKIAGENWFNVLTFCGKIDSRRLIPKLKGLGCEALVEFPGIKLIP
ncbi:MAG: hypothetical protein COT33_01135 [Candidatus Nealsonbacteria bacterium CG08_land_8_20_14_0_20_38_20]|uniref:Histidine biosynthesis HisG C-terminal domain-containing protein n=1 Tax=Candidatus Nealsonbacteria bacterium CG08_land_8_20_14_0_20_38_20 TaxID=1974705 RepID=A0A2H0YM80_9BACT|nr:MAG: hypothetical protein COT33_01135 [Candidatus Nealsonbacteria bacterium CG08_land_8_20_14_0_20_38_20]